MLSAAVVIGTLSVNYCLPYRGYEQDPGMAGRSRSQCRMKAEQLLREAIPLDKQLSSLVNRRIGGEDTIHMINQLR